MHGSVCCIVKKFVDVTHGEAAWSAILERSGHTGLVLSPIATYPDEAVLEIVTAACGLLDCERDELLVEIGRFAAGELVAIASNMIHPDWKSFELLANVESLIHRTVRIQSTGAEPARIQAFRLDDSTLQVVYSSRRGLCALADGILRGLGPVFDESIDVQHVTCVNRGDPFCTFELKRIHHESETTSEHAGNAGTEKNVDAPCSEVTQVIDLIEEVADARVDELTSAMNIQDQCVGFGSGSMHSQTQSNANKSGSIPHPKRIDRYLINEVLGVGGMGVVYQATDEVLKRKVAIKTLKSVAIEQQLTEQFLEEARAMARVSHENVIRIFDVGLFSKRPYFVMEYLSGAPLSHSLARLRFDFDEACRLFEQILSGMHAVHRIGLVHRDINPDNVMLSTDASKCYLLDFGLADQLSPRQTVETKLSGTPGYIAPERLRGYPADYRSDYFSLGCVAYEIFCGLRVDSIEKMDSDELNWNGAMPLLQQLMSGLLESDPEKRIVDSREVRDILAMARATRPVIDEVDDDHDPKKPPLPKGPRVER